MIGQAARFSIHKKAAKNRGANANNAITTGDVQPIERPNLNPIIRHSMTPNKVSAPVASKDWREAELSLRFRQITPRSKANNAKGTRPRKTACHPNHPTSRPAPKVPASIPNA